jgi:hypothetical protein
MTQSVSQYGSSWKVVMECATAAKVRIHWQVRTVVDSVALLYRYFLHLQRLGSHSTQNSTPKRKFDISSATIGNLHLFFFTLCSMVLRRCCQACHPK